MADHDDRNPHTGGQLGDVIAAIAHELSEPLTAINCYITASQIGLESAWPDLGRQPEALALVADQVARTSKALGLLRELGAALRDTR
jgi:phosphoglycerate-specific signal transduction histidine kinase